MCFEYETHALGLVVGSPANSTEFNPCLGHLDSAWSAAWLGGPRVCYSLIFTLKVKNLSTNHNKISIMIAFNQCKNHSGVKTDLIFLGLPFSFKIIVLSV